MVLVLASLPLLLSAPADAFPRSPEEVVTSPLSIALMICPAPLFERASSSALIAFVDRLVADPAGHVRLGAGPRQDTQAEEFVAPDWLFDLPAEQTRQ